MKILIITMNVANTAPGTVFEKLIQGLSISNEIDVPAADFVLSIELFVGYPSLNIF